jgi:hypothetical protein
LNENQFYYKLKDNILNSNYFLFGCDSVDIITKYYNELKLLDDQDKFILITFQTDFKLTDANEQFKDKFVFYSHSIVFCIDYSVDIKQDVFMLNTGKSLMPSGLYQQVTRTRNINKLYYFCDCKSKMPKYSSLGDVEKHYANIDNMTASLIECCATIDELEGLKVCKNKFFKLFCYNEYVIDTYNTNKLLHFENILCNNLFNLSVVGEVAILDDTIKTKMKIKKKVNSDALFDDCLNGNIQNKTFDCNCRKLNIPDNLKEKYNAEIVDKQIMIILLNCFDLMLL